MQINLIRLSSYLSVYDATMLTVLVGKKQGPHQPRGPFGEAGSANGLFASVLVPPVTGGADGQAQRHSLRRNTAGFSLRRRLTVPRGHAREAGRREAQSSASLRRRPRSRRRALRGISPSGSSTTATGMAQVAQKHHVRSPPTLGRPTSFLCCLTTDRGLGGFRRHVFLLGLLWGSEV